MMAAAAAAIGVVLGQPVGISPPDTRVLDDPTKADELYGSAPYATSTTFLIAGESCRLIQLVPSAFVVRMARAMDDLSAEQRATPGEGAAAGAGAEVSATNGANGASVSLQEALGDISLRVWAELGRARMPLGKALSMPLGAVVDLDRAADAPVDLYVNGLRFAQGHLVLTDDGEWAVCVDEVGGPPRATVGRNRLPRRPLSEPGDALDGALEADLEADGVIDAVDAVDADVVDEAVATDESAAAETDVETEPEAVQEVVQEADQSAEEAAAASVEQTEAAEEGDESVQSSESVESSEPESEGAGN
jgi:flagellar motor switch/type III secretory pathway protein FliN